MIVAPWNTRLTAMVLNKAASNSKTIVLVHCRAGNSVGIIFGCTLFNVSFTIPCVTRMIFVSHRTTIETLFVTRTIHSTSIVFNPTITHALSVVITIKNAFINKSVTNMFAFQFVVRKPKKLINY